MMRCSVPFAGIASIAFAAIALSPGASAQNSHDALVAKHAAAHGLPESLVRRVIRIESRGNPRAVSRGNYGLMQIRIGTARAMGYRGDAKGLLDADTNMTYAVKYLAGAYRAAGCNPDRAIRNYQKGYHGVRRYKCASPRTQIASAAPDIAPVPPAAANGPIAAVPQAADVLKPRVVQTVAISRRDVPSLRAPKAVATPLPLARPKPPETTAIAATEPAAAHPTAKPEAEAVPLPPVKAAMLPPRPAKQVRNARPSPVKRASARVAESKKSTSPSDLVALVRKLITPDPKSRRRAAQVRQTDDRHTQH